MSIHRYRAVQAHPTPSRVGGTGGRLDPEVMAQPARAEAADEWEDGYPPGATALNGMSLGVDMYQCEDCGAVVAEPELDCHQCGLR